MSDIKELGAEVREMLFSQMEKDDSEMLNDEVSTKKYREIVDATLRRMQRTFQVNHHAVVLENYSVDEIVMLSGIIKEFMITAAPLEGKVGNKKIGFTGDVMDGSSEEDDEEEEEEDDDDDDRDVSWKNDSKIGFVKEK